VDLDKYIHSREEFIDEYYKFIRKVQWANLEYTYWTKNNDCKRRQWYRKDNNG
jgi:hypothetical protein